MDGVRLGAWTTSSSPCVKLSGIRISATEKRQFFFSSRSWEPPEDAEGSESLDANERNRQNNRGSIRLEVYKIKAVYADITDADNVYHKGPEELETVRFEVKKETQSNKRAVRDFQWDEISGKHPIATFIFRHRPQAWLQSYGIIRTAGSSFDLDLSAMSMSNNTSGSIVNEMKRLQLADESRKQRRERMAIEHSV
ncbi:hypothetical protein DACRYDRAFT_101954 [Dacryopinax primogenitus]|uniref:Uncharacterized protein n=1 Tax=Dacryopinax primogenitus (strain DJM 731) TaxID=1858805 RepID=M5FPG1_DACPD|nr:uncharacterized protein DACRYDRAFT_101954 [Dacryopinax primogenitus]EJT98535.1 hypothetical protein DACRYDRAFT_101954 [Dacryopinax primogenitus]